MKDTRTEILIDIDGTLADSAPLIRDAEEHGLPWHYFIDKNLEVKPMTGPAHDLALALLESDFNIDVSIWTGRRERFREATMEWLNKFLGSALSLHLDNSLLSMCPDEYQSTGAQWKMEYLVLNDKNILLVIDDDIDVIDQCNQLGIGAVWVPSQ